MSRTNNHCPHCGESNGAKGDFCPRCGWKYSDPVATPVIDQHEQEENISTADAATDQPKGGKIMNTVLKILGGLLLVILIAIGLVFLFGGFRDTNVALNNNSAVTSDTAVTSAVTPTTIPEVYAEGKTEQTDANTVRLFILNPTAQPQTQIGHPSIYTETHVSGNPIKMIFDIPQGYVGIVGGYKVDSLDKGVYKAFGPGHYEIVVTDGFGLITNDNWAQAEFQFRVDQAIQFNWAHAHIVSGPLTLPATTK